MEDYGFRRYSLKRLFVPLNYSQWMRHLHLATGPSQSLSRRQVARFPIHYDKNSFSAQRNRLLSKAMPRM